MARSMKEEIFCVDMKYRGGKTFFLFIQSQSSQDKIALWISLCRIKKNNSGDMK